MYFLDNNGGLFIQVGQWLSAESSVLFIDRLFIVLTPGLGVSWHPTITLPLGMFRSSGVGSRGWSRDMHITCDSITSALNK